MANISEIMKELSLIREPLDEKDIKDVLGRILSVVLMY